MSQAVHSTLLTKGKAILLLLCVGGMFFLPLVAALKPSNGRARQWMEGSFCPPRTNALVTSQSHRSNGSFLLTSHTSFFHRLSTSDSEDNDSSNYLPESSSPISMTPQNAAVALVSQLIVARTRRRNKASTSMATSLRGGSLILASTMIPPLPTLSGWMLPALSCATCYALYNLFIKKASNSMDPILGGVLLQFVAAWIGTILWITQKFLIKGAATPAMSITRSGVVWSVAAGVAVGAAEILSFVVSGKGVPATQSIPIIIGGSIVVGTILGTVWLQERMTRTGWLGVALIAIGITLVGMEGVGGH